MGTSTFRHGALITLSGEPYRLVRMVGEHLWQIEQLNTLRVLEQPLSELRRLYAEGRLIFKKSSPATTLSPAIKADEIPRPDFSQEQWEIAKLRRLYVKEILEYPSTHKIVRPIVEHVWRSIKKPTSQPSTSAVLRWKKRYIAAGRDITALMDQNHLKGNRTSDYPDEVRQLVEESIDAKYMQRERGTVTDAVDDAIVRIKRENELRPTGHDQLPLPTRRLVSRMISEISAYDRTVARYGSVEAERRFRVVLSHRNGKGPLEIAEIDHTVLDLFVIDEIHLLPLGRPWLTVCIDTYTRCVLGIYIGFTPPSHLTVARCLEHAFLPKVTLRKDYPDIENEWDAHGVMRVLYVDNGVEFHSESLVNACYTLGIEIHFAPRKKAWFKGKVERFIGTFNRDVAHRIPGTTFSNIFERDDYKSSDYAVITLSDLKRIAHMWIADVYHQRPHRALHAPPARIWTGTVQQENIEVPDDLDQLRAILGASDRRLLTHRGIEYDSLIYGSSELGDLRRRHGEKIEVDIRVDQEDLGAIYVLPPKGGSALRVPALHKEYASGLSQWQHKKIREFARREDLDNTPEGWRLAKQRISDIIDDQMKSAKLRSRKKAARFREGGAKPEKRALETSNTPAVLTKDAGSDESVAETPREEATQNVMLSGNRAKKFEPITRDRNSGNLLPQAQE